MDTMVEDDRSFRHILFGGKVLVTGFKVVGRNSRSFQQKRYRNGSKKVDFFTKYN